MKKPSNYYWLPTLTVLTSIAILYTLNRTYIGTANERTNIEPIGTIEYAGTFKVAHGLLAKDLILAKDSEWKTKVEFPDHTANTTFGCWLMLEDTYAKEGNSRLELYIDNVFLTKFNVAEGKPGNVIQSLAELIPLWDATKQHEIKIKNVGEKTIVIEELFIRWIAS